MQTGVDSVRNQKSGRISHKEVYGHAEQDSATKERKLHQDSNENHMDNGDKLYLHLRAPILLKSPESSSLMPGMIMKSIGRTQLSGFLKAWMPDSRRMWETN